MDPMDKRKRLLQLTSAGLDCVREILMEREESLGKVVAALTEEEAREATRILKKLNDFYMAHLPNR